MSDQEQRGVWVIEEGEYDDYNIPGVFSTKENAQLVWDALYSRGRPGGPDAERDGLAFWVLDPGVDKLRAGYKYFRVEMWRDGTVRSCIEHTPPISAIKERRPDYWEGLMIPYAEPAFLQTELWAMDETQAIEAANKRLALVIANGQWIE